MSNDIVATVRGVWSAVNGVVHDHWFELAAIRFAEASATLTIPIRSRLPPQRPRRIWWLAVPRQRWPDCAGAITIRNVVRWSARDTEGVGWYDINRIDYDAAGGKIIIRTGIPLDLEAHVTAVSITAEVAPVPVDDPADDLPA